MTANEMKYLFLLKFDMFYEYGSPAYNDKQISTVFTLAQQKIKSELYNNTFNGFETSEQKRRALNQLIKPAIWVSGGLSNTITKDTINTVGIHPNGAYFKLPTDFELMVEESAILNSDLTREVLVKPITHDQYVKWFDNPYKTLSTEVVWRMDISRETDAIGITEGSVPRVEIISVAGASITQYRVRYLRKLPDIVVDEDTPSNQRHCVLDDFIHYTIVDEAIKIATAAVRPEEYQIALNEKTK